VRWWSRRPMVGDRSAGSCQVLGSGHAHGGGPVALERFQGTIGAARPCHRWRIGTPGAPIEGVSNASAADWNLSSARVTAEPRADGSLERPECHAGRRARRPGGPRRHDGRAGSRSTSSSSSSQRRSC
jgi:hypothetical protein